VRRLGILLVAAMLLGSIGIAVVLASRETVLPTAQPSDGLPSFTPGSFGGPLGETPDEPESFAFGPAGSPNPAGTGAQSRLWYNDGAWWGVFLTASSGDHRIFRLDATSLTWVDMGVVVDDRTYAKVDVLWDGDRLLVASAGERDDARHALRLNRFSYDPSSRQYRRDANFPLPLTASGVVGATLARAEDGRLWVAYRDGVRLVLDHSLDSDLSWQGPIALDLATGPVDAVAIAAVGPRIGVVWTASSEDALHSAWLDPANGNESWSVDSPTAIPNLQFGEDEIGIAVDHSPGAERMFVGLRTSAEKAANRGRLDPQVVVAELRPDADAHVFLVSRVEDQHGGPTLVIDADARLLHVIMASPSSGGTIDIKTASLNSIEFAAGPGQELIPASANLPQLLSPSSTKQSVDGGTGLVVAASDPSAGRWGFASIGLNTSTAAPNANPQERNLLVNYTFDGLATGSAVAGWEVDGDPVPSYVVVALSGSDRSARLDGTTGDARTCTTYPLVEDGVLRAGSYVLVNELPADDLKLLQLRGPGGELAAIRLRQDEVVYTDGDTRVRSGLTLDPGRWYRVVLTLDFGSRTYGLEVRDRVGDKVLLRDSGLAWTSTDVSGTDRVCAELSPQPGLELYLDNVWAANDGGND
jgi:hypothetical protein